MIAAANEGIGILSTYPYPVSGRTRSSFELGRKICILSQDFFRYWVWSIAMNSRVSAILFAGGALLFAAIYWFYDNLFYDATIAWLQSNGLPEARIFASIPPFVITAAIVWGMYSLLHSEMEKAYGSSALPDLPIERAVDYIVNDSNTPLKQPPPPEISTTGPTAGRLIITKGVEHMDALFKLEERLRRGDIEASGLRQLVADGAHFENGRRRVDPTFWNHASLMPLMCFVHTERYPQTVSRNGVSLEHFTALMVSKRDLQRCFKAKSVWKRLGDKLHRRKRINYRDPIS